MTVSCLTCKFWAHPIFDAADITKRNNLKISPHESLHWTKQDVSKCQLFGTECFVHVREEQCQNRKFNSSGEPAIYCGQSIMDNRSSNVLYIPYLHCQTINKCPMAKDSPVIINNWKQCWTFYRNPMYLMLAHRMSNLFAIRSRHIAFFKWVMTLSLCQINDQACVGGILHSIWYSDQWPSLWLLDTRTNWSFKKEQMARAAKGPRAGCGYYMHMHTRLKCVHQPYYVEVVLPQWSEGV